jgi:hypothetical protein
MEAARAGIQNATFMRWSVVATVATVVAAASTIAAPVSAYFAFLASLPKLPPWGRTDDKKLWDAHLG